jgi:hypothetical protein
MKNILLVVLLILVAAPALAVAPSQKQKENIKKFCASKGIEMDVTEWGQLMIDAKNKIRAVKIEFKYKPAFEGQELPTNEEVFYLDSADKVLGTPTTRPDIARKVSQTTSGAKPRPKPVANEDGGNAPLGVVQDLFGVDKPQDPPADQPDAPRKPRKAEQNPGGKPDGTAALSKKISISFPRETLEKAVAVWSQKAGIPAEILGGDLQLEGITKGQSFGFDESDKPAGQVLRLLLNSASLGGKLVFVVREDKVYITTRAAVEIRGETLPPEYAPRPRK